MTKILSIPLLFLATLFLVIGTSNYLSKDSDANNRSIKRTIDRNKMISSHFNIVASYLREYYKKNNEYPTQEEYDLWATDLPRNIEIYTNISNFPNEIIDKFGEPTKNSFVIALWRGEWFEYYASWVNKSTLIFDEEKYKPTIYHLLFMLFISVILYFVSYLLLSKKLQSKIESKLHDWSVFYGYEKLYLVLLKIKPYIKITIAWVSSSIIVGLLVSIAGGVGPGSYLIWYGVIMLSCIATIIHWIVFFFRSR